MSNYYEKRKDLFYYKHVKELVEKIRKKKDAQSIVDVGGWQGEFIKEIQGFKRRAIVDLHKKPIDFPDNIEYYEGDFLKQNIVEKFDIVINLQVLEHIDDANVKQFAQNLFKLGKTVIISVPYKWRKGQCRFHKQDPVDRKKVFSWTKRKPTFSKVITEKNGRQRLVLVYHN